MRKIIVLSAIILFSPYYLAFGGLEISEIMYDLKSGSDDGREWVEIYNNGNETIDFSTYKFLEAETNHRISVAQGSAKIEPHSYAIIVSDFLKFRTDWPSVSANIFDSAFSLSNTGEKIAIKNGEQVIDEFFYSSSLGGPGNGKSLQKINGAWVSSIPTPGGENKISYIPPPVVAKKLTTEVKSLTDTEANLSVDDENYSLENLLPILEENNSENLSNTAGNSYTFFGIFIALIGLSSGVVYFLRKNRKIVENEEDSDLLE